MSYHQDTWLKFEINSWKAFNRLLHYAIPDLRPEDRYALMRNHCEYLERYKFIFERLCDMYGVNDTKKEP